MRLRDGLGVLLLSRESILRVASDPHAWKVGLGFVSLATLIRVHDTVDLADKPWHLLLPLVASVAMGLWVYLVARVKCSGTPSFWAGWVQFQSLFWFTAPAAVLYVVPWEWLLSPVDAVVANLWTLAVVSAWRGLAMLKIIAVLAGRAWWNAAAVTILTGVPVAAAAMWATPIEPVIMAGMAGVRLSDHQQVMGSAATLGWLVVVIGALLMVPSLLAMAVRRGQWAVAEPEQPAGRGKFGLLTLTAIACLPVLVVLPVGQVKQQRLTRVERLFAAGDVAAMVAELSKWTPADLPLGWEPPPRVTVPAMSPDPMSVYEAVLAADSPPWLRAHYLDVLCRQYSPFTIHSLARSEVEAEATQKRLRSLLGRTEEGRARGADYGWEWAKPPKDSVH